MGALSDRATEERASLLSLFNSSEIVIEACASVIESDLALGPSVLPRVDDY